MIFCRLQILGSNLYLGRISSNTSLITELFRVFVIRLTFSRKQWAKPLLTSFQTALPLRKFSLARPPEPNWIEWAYCGILVRLGSLMKIKATLFPLSPGLFFNPDAGGMMRIIFKVYYAPIGHWSWAYILTMVWKAFGIPSLLEKIGIQFTSIY